MSAWRLLTSARIAEMPREDWASLTAADVYGRYGWLQAAECGFSAAGRARYFLLYRDGEPVAAAAAYLCTAGDPPGRLDELLFGRMAPLLYRLRPGAAGTLYFGPLIGHGRSLYWNRDCGNEAAADCLGALLSHIAGHPESRGLTLAFDRIPAAETVLLAALRAFGCLETAGWPVSYLEVTAGSLEAHVATLGARGANTPNKLRREIAAPAKSQVALRRLDTFGAHAERLHALFVATHRKYSRSALPFGPELLEALARYHADRTFVHVAERPAGGELLGCALLLLADGAASGPLIGVAPLAINRRAFTYFNLSFYVPLQACIDNGVSRLWLGGGQRHAKYRRGCETMAVHCLVRPAGRGRRLAMRALLGAHGAWLRRKSARSGR